jgi:hypothetical protein
MLMQVYNQSVSKTTFGMMSDFIGSFMMFPKKDEPRGNKELPFSLLIFCNGTLYLVCKLFYFDLRKKKSCHFSRQYETVRENWMLSGLLPHASYPKLIIIKPLCHLRMECRCSNFGDFDLSLS